MLDLLAKDSLNSVGSTLSLALEHYFKSIASALVTEVEESIFEIRDSLNGTVARKHWMTDEI